MAIKLPYELMTSHRAPQKDIEQYLKLLGASDVVFVFDEDYKLCLNWEKNGHEMSVSLSAKMFVKLWFSSEPWLRRSGDGMKLEQQEELHLAIINFWYVARDRWFSDLGRIVFNQDRSFRIASKATERLMKKLT